MTVTQYHWDQLSARACAKERYALRARLSHRMADLTDESGFQLIASHDGQNTRLHINVDMVIADAMSLQILLEELGLLLSSQNTPFSPLDYHFPQYLLEQKSTPSTGESEDYWQQRLIAGLPLAPQLPLAIKPEQIDKPIFQHREWRLAAEHWAKLQQIARQHRLTPSMLLAGCFAETLRGWAKLPDFSLNLTIFNRRGAHPQLAKLVADFTSLLILACEVKENESLLDHFRRLNQQFMADLDHGDYSAVHVLRQWSQQRGEQVTLPVVFTSNLGRELLGENAPGALHYLVSQTPQVWLDCQVMEYQKALLISWDTVDALFPEGMLDQMFAFMQQLLQSIVENEQVLQSPVQAYVDDKVLAHRQPPLSGVNGVPFEAKTLHQGFWQQVALVPNNIAVINASGALTYREMAIRVGDVAGHLQQRMARQGHVGICLPKGIDQVIAVLAVLSIGAVYVPLDITAPPERLQQLIAQADIGVLISDHEISANCDTVNINITGGFPSPFTPSVFTSSAAAPSIFAPSIFVQPDEPAYLIFTSGSTGVPKGVVVTHQAAMNTIDEINRRYVDDGKIILFALSALNFDLSVYDIFGPLSVGGSLVLPNAGDEKEAKQWLSALHQHQVTHWNSVPALFEMLLIAAEQGTQALPRSLQQVLLSGDWIGLDLLPRLRALGSPARFTALGGATEAAIWSNALDIAVIPEEWVSIPYGYPLAHQYYRVVDQAGRDCPDWVTGELWIGGRGVALGYYREPEKTAAQFVSVHRAGFYRTGDYGRFWLNGCLEFLGRQDRQIKLHGYRIELAEIEAVAEHLATIKRAVVLYLDQPQKHLYLFVEPQNQVPTLFSATVDDVLPETRLVTDIREQENAITTFLLCHVLSNVLKLDLAESQSTQVLQQKGGISEAYQPLFLAWLHWLVEQGVLLSRDDQFKTAGIQPVRPEVTEPHLLPLLMTLEQKASWIGEVVTGRGNPLLLLDDTLLSPEVLAANTHDAQVVIDVLCQRIVRLSRQLQRPVHVTELNGRTGLFASRVLSRLGTEVLSYCLLESANSLRQHAKYRLAGYSHETDVIATPDEQQQLADILIVNNSLHRFDALPEGIAMLQSLCHGGTEIVLFESLALSPLSLLTVLLLQHPNGFRDQRQGALSPLLDLPAWQSLLTDSGIAIQQLSIIEPYSALFVCQPQITKVPVSREQIKQHLQQHLPAYMVPSSITVLETLPLTPNGKIDRTSLYKQAVEYGQLSHDAEAPRVLSAQQKPPDERERSDNREQSDKRELSDKKEQCVARLWQQVLGVTPQSDSNFFLCGGDSLHATRIVALLEKEGAVGVPLSQVFLLPVLRDFAHSLAFRHAPVQEAQLVHCAAQRYSPFELTDVQRAYLMGRQSGFPLGGVATHYYQEYEYQEYEYQEYEYQEYEYQEHESHQQYKGTPFDRERLERALTLLVARHDALRIVFDEQGTQRVLPHQPSPALQVIHCGAVEWETVTATQRDRLSHHVSEPTQWPLFHATLIQSDEGRNRFCLGLDNLVLDGLSMQIFFKELAVLYEDHTATLPSVEIGFRDYLLAESSSPHRQVSEDYWRESLPMLPDAPRLPLVCDPALVGTPKFKRWQAVLSASDWQMLLHKAKQHQITPSCLLLTCYAQVLAKWSESASLTINVTLFDRKPCHPDINHIMGDFTSLLLLGCRQEKGEGWLATAQRIQQQLWRDLEHREVSAVWVLRELNRQRGTTHIHMPVVFTSALGAQVDGYPDSAFQAPLWGISQTPQLWIDHQVFERDGELHFNWDVVEALFPVGVIDAMFAAYCQLLEKLCVTEHWHDSVEIALPAPQQQSRQRVNATHQAMMFSPMHCRVAHAMAAYAQQTALIWGGSRLSYQQLEHAVQRLAQYLHEQGVRESAHVGVALPRGCDQIIAVLAIQWLGAAYVPISVEWPACRRSQVITLADIHFLIGDRTLGWPEEVDVLSVESEPVSDERPTPRVVSADSLAYLIFTSGSTGVPKGVAVSHGAAVNTIESVNRQHQINPQDTALALSALYFDLSVWDVFGVLSAGARLVLIPQQAQREAAIWLSLVQQHQVTVWNSVPALLEMMLLFNEQDEQPPALPSLRVVMLSGDWIVPELPQRLRRFAPNAHCVAMGGATEAAIWSNYWVADTALTGWCSVPYGVPLPNQQFRIVNEQEEDCPDWVAGELWIGGQGVAQGYYGDSAGTEQQFILRDGQRWYRTGDTGRYRPDAIIEFLGRKDQQVKISGYRVELDEITLALKSYPSIEDAVAFVIQHNDRPVLAAVAVTPTPPDWQAVTAFLRERLPEYAIPSRLGHCCVWPLTDNGKRDQHALRAFVTPSFEPTETPQVTQPMTAMEQLLCEQLQLLLNVASIQSHDNFFALGGDSFIAIRLTSVLRRNYGVELPLWKIFSVQIIAQIALVMEPAHQSEGRIQFVEDSI